jgi:site-specific DNA-methyltransferase (adenine-specific)
MFRTLQGKEGEKVNEHQIELFGSKKTDDWQTPEDFYNKLLQEFSFNFDPCPFHSKFDGLNCDWGTRCFVNPPYSKVKEFLKKAWEEIDKGNCKVAVFLTFANTDTQWFHEYVLARGGEIRFIKGRLKFIGEDGIKNSAMRPSILIILRRREDLDFCRE